MHTRKEYNHHVICVVVAFSGGAKREKRTGDCARSLAMLVRIANNVAYTHAKNDTVHKHNTIHHHALHTILYFFCRALRMHMETCSFSLVARALCVVRNCIISRICTHDLCSLCLSTRPLSFFVWLSSSPGVCVSAIVRWGPKCPDIIRVVVAFHHLDAELGASRSRVTRARAREEPVRQRRT